MGIGNGSHYEELAPTPALAVRLLVSGQWSGNYLPTGYGACETTMDTAGPCLVLAQAWPSRSSPASEPRQSVLSATWRFGDHHSGWTWVVVEWCLWWRLAGDLATEDGSGWQSTKVGLRGQRPIASGGRSKEAASKPAVCLRYRHLLLRYFSSLLVLSLIHPHPPTILRLLPKGCLAAELYHNSFGDDHKHKHRQAF